MGVFIAANTHTLLLCMELLSTGFITSDGSTWWLQSACKLLANLTSTSLNIPWGNENEALSSIMPLKTAIAHIGWVAVSVWMRVSSIQSRHNMLWAAVATYASLQCICLTSSLPWINHDLTRIFTSGLLHVHVLTKRTSSYSFTDSQHKPETTVTPY